MSRLYSLKLVVLFICCYIVATNVGAQKWIGVLSNNPAQPTVTTSGSIQSSTGISIDIPGFYLSEEIYEGNLLYSAQLQGGHPLLIKGSPELENFSFVLEIPANGNLDIVIESSQFTDYFNIELCPSQGDVIKKESNPVAKKSEVYNINEYFPGKIISAEKPFIVRNKRAQAFQVYPLQYNPVTKVLRFYSNIIVKLTHTEGIGDNPLTESDLSIASIDCIEAGYLKTSDSDYKSGTLPSDKGSMLIISPEEFNSAVKPLAEWRIQTGIATEIVNSEQFSNPEEIYNFIKTYYYNNPTLAYLLLVGDAKQVPPFTLPYGASDNYYSYLAGNDHYPDILVGRFSAESVKDVEVQVNRTLQYEKNPGTNTSWITNATGIGSTLSPGDDGESDFQHVRNLLKTLKTSTYSTINEFFDGSQGGSDSEGNPSTSDIVEKINQGTGVIFYAGHGTPNILATGSLTKDVIENLDNTGKYPLIWSAACEAGNFANKYCNAEAWLRATNGKEQPAGALAAVMASGSQTSFPPMQAQDKIAEILNSPTESLSTMGAISVKGMMSMNDAYGNAGFVTTDTWILFGDPSLKIRTAQPIQLKVEHKGTIGFGRTFYNAICNATTGYACISSNGVILGKGKVENGIITILLDRPAEGETMTLTVTALNYLPVIEKINVVRIPGAIEFCNPVNHSKIQSINSALSWEAGDGGTPDYYLVYFGTNNPPNNILNGVKVTSGSCKPQFNLEYDQSYYWRVVAVNSYGSNEGKIMTFNTVFKPDEDFESENKNGISWIDGGSSNWTIDRNQYFDGTRAIRSGQINNNEHTSLIYPCEVKNCDFVSFWSKTSSETGDKLQFLVDGNTSDEWSGQSDWTFHIYKIEPGFHQLEWRYVKNDANTSGEDAVWLDNLHLPIHLPANAQVNEQGSVCQGAGFETSASAQNYFNVQWITDGDGKFDDNTNVNAIYTPGSIETENRKTTLHIKIKGYDGCPVLSKSVHLDIHSLPVISLPSDTLITEGSSVTLDATIPGNNSYEWQPYGSRSAQINIDSLSSINHSKSATLIVSNDQGCTSSKIITIHFNNPAIADEYKIYPNPSNGNFTLQPLKGSSVIETMKLIDGKGQVMWSKAETINIIGSKEFSIDGLTTGEYYLVSENKNGHSVNPIIFR